MNDISAYLDAHEKKSLLRFLTCGSVDDGKSTLIGRLLYDSKLIFDDQLSALREASGKNGTTGAGEIDYALLLDGLKAEREQGITIDVAYRYFATPRRKFIIADCPGHEQYTRNMATGASTADLAIILIDARHGVITQTRRHAFIVSLLGIRHIVVAVNKMDLVDYSEARFREIEQAFRDFWHQAHLGSSHTTLTFIPLSALKGTNVVEPNPALTPYYTGPALLPFLETVDIGQDRNLNTFRFPVQTVIRPNLDFRGFAGSVASGTIRPGEEVTILPSGKTSRVKAIVTADGNLEVAFPPQAVVLTLEDEIDISSGDWIVKRGQEPQQAQAFRVHLLWMDAAPLKPGRDYLLRHGSAWLKARVTALNARIDVNTLARSPAEELPLNAIAEVTLETTRPIPFDPYTQNRATGRFILVDPVTNATAGAGMIITALRGEALLPARVPGFRNGLVPPARRAQAQRHRGAWLKLAGEDAPRLAARLEERLFGLQVNAYLLCPQNPEAEAALPTLAAAFVDAGFLFLSAHAAPESGLSVTLGEVLQPLPAGENDEATLAALLDLLIRNRILPDPTAWGL